MLLQVALPAAPAVQPEEPQAVVQPGVPEVLHSEAVDLPGHLPEQSPPGAASSPAVEQRPQAAHPQSIPPGPSS